MKDEIIRLLRIKKETKDFVIDDVNLHIFKGEIVGLLGLSKTGKSSIVHILIGREAPDSGKILIKNKAYNSLVGINAKRSGIYSLGLRDNIIKNLTVAENLFALNRSPFHISYSRKEMNIKARYVLKQFKLNISETTLARNISHTDQALICLIKIALASPSLIIIDSGIEYEVENIEAIVDIIKLLKKTGISFLIVSNKINRLINVCDGYYFIKENTLTNRLDGNFSDKEVISRLLMNNLFTDTQKKKAADYSSTPVFKVENLKHLENQQPVSFELYKSEIALLIPPANIISDTIANCLFGLIPHAEGRILVKGKEIKLNSAQDAIKSGIALISDESNMTIFRNLSLKDNLLLPYFANHNYMLRHVDQSFQKVATDELKKGYFISDKTDTRQIKNANPSIIEIHKISLARWEALKPQIYIFLNPFSVVDEIGSKNLLSQMIRLTNTGCSVLIISNNSYGLNAENIRTIKL